MRVKAIFGSKAFLIALLVMVFIVSLIAHMPASLVVKHLPLPAKLSLDGVSGTIWKGSASNVAWQRTSIGEVDWNIDVLPLFLANVEAQVRFGRGSDLGLRGKGIVGYKPSGPYAKNLIASMAAEKIVSFVNPGLPVTLGGQMELSVRHIDFGDPQPENKVGTLVWNNSYLGSPIGSLKLGPVMADVNYANNQWSLAGKQNNGQLSSDFSAQLNNRQGYSVKGWFKPGADFPTDLVQQLQWLGRPDNQGRFHFNHSGRI
ncbi:type II secretion system protein N [Vibrio marisflavi]|uniref:Type II secretion system protein N n=1 Tax=Vibrio marisflavi CECT 7928 TaxID=634439 RepID=A0ABN8E7P3_9VIBR|nr:type II secretion system protein N [Vibrio marisflavi]CAH0541852.1 Type II secretion system protein N [Vibrio marisflavi CECT 7928]